MSNFKSWFGRRVKSFRQDQDGMEAVQSILLVALAAILLIGFQSFYDKSVRDQTGKAMNDIVSSTSTMTATPAGS
jgi:hypothetical protein